MKDRIKFHLRCLRDSVIVVGSLTTIAAIVWLGWQIGSDIAMRSESFYKAQEMLRSYNENHTKRETWHIYQPGRNEGVK